MRLVFLISIIFSLLCISVDFSTRFLNGTNNNNNNMKRNAVSAKSISLPQLSLAQIKQLNNAFNKYQPEPTIEKETLEALAGLTAEQQLQQSGKLLEFYQGDWRYRLLAVIFPENTNQALKTPLALLRATNTKDSSIKIEKIYHKAKLANYDIEITDIKQVNLKYQQQNITLLMYQPNK